MFREWMRKIRTALSGKQLLLQKKAKVLARKAVLTASVLCYRLREAINWELIRSWILTNTVWLRTHLDRESLKDYAAAAAKWIRELPENMTRENFKKWSLMTWAWLKTVPGKCRNFRRNALAMSCLLLALWLFMGTSTSLAWFNYTTPTKRNTFEVQKFDLSVKYGYDLNDPDSFRDLEGSTSVFDDAALYEPGYTQVVYFEVTNEGNVPFDYKVETTVASQRAAENVLGDTFTLQPYLRYAVTYTPETDTVSREKTRLLQNVDLYHLDQLAPFAPESIAPGRKDYVAIVVHMPESVGNEANYRGDTIPEIILGIRVTAVQTGLSETNKAEALAAEMTN